MAVNTRDILRASAGVAICLILSIGLAAAEAGASRPGGNTRPLDQVLRRRLERSLDRWCRWVARNLKPVPGTDLYTFHPTLHGYRAVAGNQFAAAAVAGWLARTKPNEEIALPLRGLIKLALGTHVAVKTVDRPDIIRPWGATYSGADNWHADLFAATSGMVMLGGLPPDQHKQLLAILAWEADQQIEYGFNKRRFHVIPRLGGGSVGEANAWSAALLQAARSALPDSPRQGAWRDSAINYSLNAICVPADVTSDRAVAGKPLKDRVKGANFEPGGIQEHHGFYHPGYVGWTLAYQAFAQLMDEAMPHSQRNPDVYLNNWKLAFDRLKQATLPNGRFIYCAGSDWINYGYGNAHILPIGLFAAARFGDPDAARLADEWLKLVEHEQALSGGAVQGVRLATLHRLGPRHFGWYESISGASLATALWVMDHVDTSKMPQPSSEEEYNARNVGTYHEPGARLVWHRDRRRWASCSWRSAFREWQAFVQPVCLPNLLRFNHNSTGIIQAAGTAQWARIRATATDTFHEGGFWSLGTIDRLRRSKGGKHGPPLVRQHQALIALPEGPSVFVDQCQALEELQLLRTGGLGMRLAADIFNGNQVKILVEGAERAFGQHPDRDTWHDLRTRSITIEKQLTIHAISGDGSFQLLQKRRRPPDRSRTIDRSHDGESLLSHELYFGPPACEQPRTVGPGSWFRNVVLVIHCDPQQAAIRPSATITGQHPCFAVHLPAAKRTIAINFADTEHATDSPAGRITVAPRSVRVVP